MEAIDFANFDAAVSTQRWRLPTSRDAGCMSSGDRLTEKTERAGASVRQDLYRPPGGASSRYPGSCTKGPIQVETQEPPYGKNAVFTGILATTEAPA